MKRTCRQTRHGGRTCLARRRARARGTTRRSTQAALGCASHSTDNKVRHWGGGRRRHSLWVGVGVVAGSVQGVRGGKEEVHDIEVPALLLFPRDGTPARPPRTTPGASTATHCSAPPPSLPHSLPPTSPLSSSCSGGPRK
jgi:hypothetical protein